MLRGVLFDLHYRRNDVGTARLGLVIPKRNVRMAVLRNRFKRLAREVFRGQRQSLPTFDLVLRLARPLPSDALENAVLREDIERLLSRLPTGMSQ